MLVLHHTIPRSAIPSETTRSRSTRSGVPLDWRIEPIGALRFVLPIEPDLEPYVIANAGLRLSPVSPKWALIPEASFAWGTETDSRLEGLAVGFAWLP